MELVKMTIWIMQKKNALPAIEVAALAAVLPTIRISLKVTNWNVHMVILLAPHGYDRSDKLIITLDSSPSNTIYLGDVVALRFHLQHANLAHLGGLEQQLVAGLDAGVRRVLVILDRGILGTPGVLLAGTRELVGPQRLLLPHIWSLLGTWCKYCKY